MVRFPTLFVVCVGLSFLSANVSAQGILSDINGNVLRVNSYGEVGGTPYFETDEWLDGVITIDGIKSGTTKLKYDLVADALLYLDPSGNTIQITTPIQEFFIYGLADSALVFRSGYEAIDKNSEKSFYQVLVDGHVQLLKKSRKAVHERVSYGSSVKEVFFDQQSNYYIFSDTEGLSRVTNKTSFFKAVATNTPEIESYVRQNRVNFRNEEDLISLIMFVNSL